ncbi:hypothetical protein [Pseudoduganella sp. RAF53_2]|uniref:hypothetical protein n=1 Tax=unclassified Pseudoduganella TaxID=2637179 RepID=UPI003F94A910
MSNPLLTWLTKLSHMLGLSTAESFPSGHAYARTRWDKAYFDIASDVKPDDIERRICEAIANTPLVFAHITNPTPGMQRVLFGLIEQRLRLNHEREAGQLAVLLIKAYESRDIQEASSGLRAAIASTEGLELPTRVRALLAFLADMQSPFGVIEMRG